MGNVRGRPDMTATAVEFARFYDLEDALEAADLMARAYLLPPAAEAKDSHLCWVGNIPTLVDGHQRNVRARVCFDLCAYYVSVQGRRLFVDKVWALSDEEDH